MTILQGSTAAAAAANGRHLFVITSTFFLLLFPDPIIDHLLALFGYGSYPYIFPNAEQTLLMSRDAGNDDI